MSSYIFSGIIKCGDCSNKYRGKLERKKRTYICQGYMKKLSDCTRFSIEENVLVDTIKSHFNSDIIDLDQIASIEVKNQTIRIIYADKTTSVLSSTKYIV